VSPAVIQIFVDVLAAYRLHGDDAIDASRALRSALHGLIALESGGGFGRDVDVDRSFERMVQGVAIVLSQWTDAITPRAVSACGGPSWSPPLSRQLPAPTGASTGTAADSSRHTSAATSPG